MRTLLKSLLIIGAAIPGSAAAQSFLPYAGATGNAHYAIEPLAAGFTATDKAVLSHGSLPAISTYTSGIAAVAVPGSAVSISFSHDGRSLEVSGTAGAARYSVLAIDGRTLASGTLADPRVDISALASGHYLLCVTEPGAAPCVFKFNVRN